MINKVILMGRLTREPELRYTDSKKPVCSFTVAVNNGYGEKQTTDFIPCVAWNKTAEFVSKYFSKGKMMVLVGKLGSRTWEGSDGKKHYSTEVVAQEIGFGESKKDAGRETVVPVEEEFLPVLDDEGLPF